MYRFLFTPRWLGLALLMALASATMVGLGLWQLDRFHQRSAINSQIADATTRPPTALNQVLAAPDGERVGPVPPTAGSWTIVTATGVYDSAHEILARERPNSGQVGFEVVTPLVLANGVAVLVDRGWIPSGVAGANQVPQVPPAPPGSVTVVGRVHQPESRANTPTPFGTGLAVRRISPAKAAGAMPYPLYGAYLTLEQQTPPIDTALRTIEPDHQNATMNAGYVVQWWILAGLALVGYGYMAYREANPTARA